MAYPSGDDTGSGVTEEQAGSTGRWANHYAAVATRLPRPHLLDALSLYHGEPGLAIDLGCGAGNETIALLGSGWHVLAIDREEEAIRRVIEVAGRSLLQS